MKQALLITNLKARSVSPRVKQVIEKALSADLKLEVAETEGRNHASELAREAAAQGFDLVISFGGDGTMNEIVNGLVGSETALAVLPGGLANVLCRTIGVPVDIVEATGFLLNRLKSAKTKPINLGRIDDRYFVLSCGVGIDAATVRRTEENAVAKKKYRDWYFVYAALQSAFTEYRGRKPHITLEAEGVYEQIVLAIATNVPHFTYFKNWPITLTPDAKLESGLDLFAMREFPMTYIPRLAWSIFRSNSHTGSKHSIHLNDIRSLSLSSSAETFPVQLDGEFIGERTDLKIELVEDAVSILV